jgi:hypothetical protein
LRSGADHTQIGRRRADKPCWCSARVEKLLAEHQPEPLTDEVQGKLRKIVERAVKQK